MGKRHDALSARPLALRAWVPYALFAIACGLAAAASWYVSFSGRSQRDAQLSADRVKFEADAANARQQISFRLETYVEVARAGAALIGASNEINGAEFRAFVRELRLRERYPGMIGIGYAPRVRHESLSAFARSVSQDSRTQFRMRPSDRRAEHFPVLFLEPTDRETQFVLGFDLGSDAGLLAAIDRARDSGAATATGVLTSSPFMRRPGRSVLVIIPVYTIGTPADTLDVRRRRFNGFVFSLLDAEAALDPLVAGRSDLVSLEVSDGSGEALTLLAGSAAGLDRPRFESIGQVQFAGRDWLVRANSLERPVPAEWRASAGTLAVGLVLSICLFLISGAQVRAWETAARHEAELRASAQALRESEAKAQAADRAKDEFLATLSHELRTPLNAILGWVSMLRGDSVPPDRRGHGLAVIERNARLQAHLIEDLLDVSRIIMGQVRLQMRPFAVAPVIFGTVESLRPGADAKGVQLVVSLEPDVVIQGDTERIQQIVWNLVANGIKFTPRGGHVNVDLVREGEQMRISVRDTGMGITADFLPHVFERFTQADSSTTRAHMGIGIGLAIVQHLVELHGGSIEVRSEGRDHGAEFVIYIPIATPALPVAAIGQNLAPDTPAVIH